MPFLSHAFVIRMFALLVAMNLARVGGAQIYPPGIVPRDRALMEACIYGDAEKATALLEQGANANYVLPGGRTALHWAAANGHSEVVRVLIDRGAEVNAQDDTKRTPLMEAAGAHDPTGLKMLLE